MIKDDDGCITKIHQDEDHETMNIGDVDKDSMTLLAIGSISNEYYSETVNHEEVEKSTLSNDEDDFRVCIDPTNTGDTR